MRRGRVRVHHANLMICGRRHRSGPSSRHRESTANAPSRSSSARTRASAASGPPPVGRLCGAQPPDVPTRCVGLAEIDVGCRAVAAITHERESCIPDASTIANYVERSEGDGNNILEEGSAMSATDKLVEKNCRRADLAVVFATAPGGRFARRRRQAAAPARTAYGKDRSRPNHAK